MKYRPLWSFSWFTEEYEISKQTVVVTKGLFNLYNDMEATSSIIDIDTKRSFLQRILGLITIYLKFEHGKTITLKNLPNPELFTFVEYCRILIAKRKRVDVL